MDHLNPLEGLLKYNKVEYYGNIMD